MYRDDMTVNHPALTRSQRLVLSLLSSEWMTGPDLATAVAIAHRRLAHWSECADCLAGRPHTPPSTQGVHQTIASLVRRGYVEKYRIHGVVRFRAVPDANRGPDRVVLSSR